MRGPNARLILGTVQLGLPYGIANTHGQPALKTAEAIVSAAWDGGIRVFDTAQGYGTSESVLGNSLHKLGVSAEAEVITKLAPDLPLDDQQAVTDSVNSSLARLGVRSLKGLFLHREEQLAQLDGPSASILNALREQGLTASLGVSVYTPEAALVALRHPLIDRVQLPSNLLDRRFEQANIAEEAKVCGKTLDIRSVFLQGLLALPPDKLPTNMKHAVPVLKRLHQLLQKLDLEAVDAALLYVREAWPKANVVIGAEHPSQVEDTLARWAKIVPKEFIHSIREAFPAVEKRILNPGLWTKT